jgi:3-hydroxyacyl-[acyl-carrier-protein] dehydratase
MTATSDEIFKVESLVSSDNVIKANLSVNADSQIFKGHFPGQPVVPGACMLQIVKEVLEKALGQSLQLKKATQLKFISMIDPLKVKTVQLEITYKFIDDVISIVGKITNEDILCFKFQGTFIKVS